MAELNRIERKIFDEIIDVRDESHWTPHRLAIATLLARTIYMVQLPQDAIERDGFVTVNGRGNPEVHPNVRIASQGIQQICAYRRSLGIHARALGGEARDIARRRRITLEHQRNAPPFGDDFARPNLSRFGRKQEDDNDGE